MKINWKNKIYKGKNQDYLTYKSSITNKISQKASLRIERNKDFPNTIFNDEKLFFKTGRSGSLFLREVLIYANDEPIIYARTVFKKNLRQLTGLVKKLNENPLANIVFKKKTKRSEFIFSNMSPNYKLSKRLIAKQIAIKKFVGARQSNFLCKGERILLTEIFFEDINRFR